MVDVGEVLRRALGQSARPAPVAPASVMHRRRVLDQPVEQSLVGCLLVEIEPRVFPGIVCGAVVAGVEHRDTDPERVLHTRKWSSRE